MALDNVRASISNDSDGDSKLDDFDNCPNTPNPNQSDLDGDSIGDLCDTFPNGGSDLLQCQSDLNVCLSNPLGQDEDEDGEADITDSCPNTLIGSAVDESGCSQNQFCSLFTIPNMCVRADWGNDDTIKNSNDCKWDARQISVHSCIEY